MFGYPVEYRGIPRSGARTLTGDVLHGVRTQNKGVGQ